MVELYKKDVNEDIFDFHHQRIHYGNFGVLGMIYSLKFLEVKKLLNNNLIPWVCYERFKTSLR